MHKIIYENINVAAGTGGYLSLCACVCTNEGKSQAGGAARSPPAPRGPLNNQTTIMSSKVLGPCLVYMYPQRSACDSVHHVIDGSKNEAFV